MTHRTISTCLLVALALVLLASITSAMAQDTTDLEQRISRLESRENVAVGAVTFLFGAFCALWAQNTGRSAWAWFFLGVFFMPVTVIVLLVKNARESRHLAPGGQRADG